MSSVASLRSQVAAIRAKIGRPADPKQFTFTLEEGEELPAHIQELIGENDSVYIRRYARGLLGPPETGKWEPAIGWMTTAQGRTTGLYRSGKTYEVRQDSTRAVRRH